MPVYVHGRLWGTIAVGSGQGPLPPDTEQRMTEFTELISTAVANAQSRAELMASRARIVAASDDPADGSSATCMTAPCSAWSHWR
jgi:GAF domain-containing protein